VLRRAHGRLFAVAQTNSTTAASHCLRVSRKSPYQFDNNKKETERRRAEAVMHGLTKVALLVALMGMSAAAHAVDRGQFGDVPDHVRKWFKSVIAPNGVPCCDISDGHRTDYDMRDGAFWVPIEGTWMQVPERAVIRDAGNPIGEAVVWYVHHRGSIVISCFVPGGGA
jgi:hypothetical protein